MNAFTYGTLMFPEVIQNLTEGRVYESRDVILKGYGRRHVKGRVYPGLIVAPAEEVKGKLYLNLSNEDMKSLDYFEGTEYQKI